MSLNNFGAIHRNGAFLISIKRRKIGEVKSTECLKFIRCFYPMCCIIRGFQLKFVYESMRRNLAHLLGVHLSLTTGVIGKLMSAGMIPFDILQGKQ